MSKQKKPSDFFKKELEMLNKMEEDLNEQKLYLDLVRDVTYARYRLAKHKEPTTFWERFSAMLMYL
jgi:hypothetical protein